MIRFEPGVPRRRLAGQLLWFLLWAVTTAVALYLRPDPSGHGTHVQLGLAPCPSVLLFGRPCPGCGLTTSWTAVVHGQLALAWSANPLGPFLYLGFTVSAALALFGWLKRAHLDLTSAAFNRFAVATLAVFLLFATYRFLTTTDYRVGGWPGGDAIVHTR